MTSRPSAGRYKVTKAALALVGLIRSSLQEACEAGTPAAVQSGCNAVLDMASLLIAVPHGVHGEQLQVGALCAAGHLPHSVKGSCRSASVVTRVGFVSKRGSCMPGALFAQTSVLDHAQKGHGFSADCHAPRSSTGRSCV